MVKDLESRLREILPNARHKTLDAILDACAEALSVSEVEPGKTHAPIETVHAYGLVLGVDANGYAATVEFPHGAVVTGW